MSKSNLKKNLTRAALLAGSLAAPAFAQEGQRSLLSRPGEDLAIFVNSTSEVVTSGWLDAYAAARGLKVTNVKAIHSDSLSADHSSHDLEKLSEELRQLLGSHGSVKIVSPGEISLAVQGGGIPGRSGG